MDSLLHDIEGMLRRNRAVSLKPCAAYKVEKTVRVRNGIKRTVYSAKPVGYSATAVVEETKPVEPAKKTKEDYLAEFAAIEAMVWNPNCSEKQVMDRWYALSNVFEYDENHLKHLSDDDALAVLDEYAMTQITIEKGFDTIL